MGPEDIVIERGPYGGQPRGEYYNSSFSLSDLYNSFLETLNRASKYSGVGGTILDIPGVRQLYEKSLYQPKRTATPAEIRYKNSKRKQGRYGWYDTDEVEQNTKPNTFDRVKKPAKIFKYVTKPGDTTYVEYPAIDSRWVEVRYPRSASTSNPKGDEYEILRRRFNTAWGLAQ